MATIGERLKAMGFTREGTGGGCEMAWRAIGGTQYEIAVTGGESDFPPPDAVTVYVGFHHRDESEEMEYRFDVPVADLEKAVAELERKAMALNALGTLTWEESRKQLQLAERLRGEFVRGFYEVAKKDRSCHCAFHECEREREAPHIPWCGECSVREDDTLPCQDATEGRG